MIEAVIMTLIYICVIVALAWIIIWVIGQLGLPIPAQVIKILWVIVALLCLLLILRVLLPPLGVRMGDLVVSPAQAQAVPALVAITPLCAVLYAQHINVTQNRQLSSAEVRRCFFFLAPQPVYEPRR